jgi:dTDP-4-amino-4,6-dideoxygalactose transaminase
MSDSAEKIPVFKPLLEREEYDAVKAALELGWLGMGSFVSEFERELARRIDVPEGRVVAVSTGHAALHLSLLLAGVGAGDEVITPSFNNVADLQAILAAGARPVFCDIDLDTLCIDVAAAEALIGPRTKAIIVMDYGCRVCDHAAIQALAARRGLRVIHDAAHSLGSTWQRHAVGSFSDLTMFSFDPIKTITAIDGGAVIVQNAEQASALHEMRLIGMGQSSAVMYGNQRAWTYDVARLGFRYHLANLHAAIGLAQLAKFEVIARTRRAAFERYSTGLRGCSGLSLSQADMASIVPFIFPVRVLDGRREVLQAHLSAKGVETGIHWRPGHHFSLFRDCRRGNLKNTEQIASEVLTIPFHSKMREGDQDRVIDAVVEFFSA